ncbi:hypothetical protein FS749_009853 [Ceratobasidium sp. UAMH 11750]|nr:hypothetical protein FS749_009853 [Ceratobasidium sp. UAMH 11750]
MSETCESPSVFGGKSGELLALCESKDVEYDITEVAAETARDSRRLPIHRRHTTHVNARRAMMVERAIQKRRESLGKTTD